MVDFKSLSISKKVHIPLILSMLIGTAIIVMNVFYSMADLEKDVYSTESKNLKNFLANRSMQKKISGSQMQLISRKTIA